MPPAGTVVEHLFRHEAGRMVSALTRVLGPRHLELADEVVQDALVKALETWPFSGVPDNPAAWLSRVAKNRALDALRRDATIARKEPEIIRLFNASSAASGPFADDRLAMMFLCCHPSLPRPARIALTLKTVGGFSVSEIARAFLSEESAVAQRLVRAKRQIRDRSLSFESLPQHEIEERLDSVLEVIYLMFNEGYAAHAGDRLLRRDVSEEAIFLGRLIAAHPVTALPRTHALLALMLFHAARYPARTTAEGDLLLLEGQDRSLWHQGWIAEAFYHLDLSAQGESISPYHLQAGIAAAHAAAPSYAATDWNHICRQYDHLFEIDPSPVVALNRALALSRTQGPATALPMLLALDRKGALPSYHLLPAAIGELYRELGCLQEAGEYYQQALAIECSEPERRYLERRLASLTSS